MEDGFSIKDMEQRKRDFRESLYQELEDRLIRAGSDGNNPQAHVRHECADSGSVPEKNSREKERAQEKLEKNIHSRPPERTGTVVESVLQEEKGADYKRLFISIIDRRNIILAITLVIFLATLFLTLSEPCLYQANAKILRKQTKSQFVPSGAKGAAGKYTIETVKDIMKTAPVLKKVIEDLKLDMSIGSLSSKIILSLTKNSDVVKVAATDETKERAIAIVNEFSNSFIQNEIALKQKQVINSFNYLESQRAVVQEQLSVAEQKLQDFKKKFGLVQLNTDIKLSLDKLASFDTKYRLALVESKALDDKIKKLKKEYDEQEAEVILRSTYKQPLQNQLVKLETELAQALTKYTEENPQVIKIRDQIVTTKEMIKKNVGEQASVVTYGENTVKKSVFEKLIFFQTEKLANASKVEALKNIRDNIEKGLEGLPEKEAQYLDLERKKLMAENAYKFLAKKREEARLAKELAQGGFELIEQAHEASKISPKTKMSCILGLITGLIIALIAALGMEYYENTVKTPQEVKENLGLQTLGTIPIVAEQERLINPDPQISMGGAFGFIADSLRNAGLNKNHTSLLIASTEEGEGKSFVADNLALTHAFEGDLVVMADVNLRNASHHSLLKPKDVDEEIPGLWDYLEGRSEADDILRETETENLHVIMPGKQGVTNPLKLLKSDRMTQLIKLLDQRYNLFVARVSETSNFSDATILSSMMDGVLLVVEYGKVNAEKIRRVTERIKGPDSNILGAIINKEKRFSLLRA